MTSTAKASTASKAKAKGNSAAKKPAAKPKAVADATARKKIRAIEGVVAAQTSCLVAVADYLRHQAGLMESGQRTVCEAVVGQIDALTKH